MIRAAALVGAVSWNLLTLVAGTALLPSSRASLIGGLCAVPRAPPAAGALGTGAIAEVPFASDGPAACQPVRSSAATPYAHLVRPDAATPADVAGTAGDGVRLAAWSRTADALGGRWCHRACAHREAGANQIAARSVRGGRVLRCARKSWSQRWDAAPGWRIMRTLGRRAGRPRLPARVRAAEATAAQPCCHAATDPCVTLVSCHVHRRLGDHRWLAVSRIPPSPSAGMSCAPSRALRLLTFPAAGVIAAVAVHHHSPEQAHLAPAPEPGSHRRRRRRAHPQRWFCGTGPHAAKM